jgi:two-component system, LytTR family, response regulator
MKIRCLLVDDEPLAIQLLQNHLAHLDNFEVVGVANNAVKALELLHEKAVDLLFLDIKMPKITGIELLKSLKNPPAVILTTAYREFALDGYDLDITDYLLKPITFERFLKAVSRFLNHHKKQSLVNHSMVTSETKTIQIKSGNKYLKINPAEILYIESQKDYIKCYTKDREIVAKYKISDLETMLADKGFLRVHRSFIVHLMHVTAHTATEIEIGDHICIPIGTNYKMQVNAALGMA